jgi:hypothetical protein
MPLYWGNMEFTLTAPDPTPPKDTRFAAFKEWIERAYQWKWNAMPRWGGMEAKNLWTLLQEMPDLKEKQFCIALKNLLNSHDIPAMQRPGYWLPKIDSYLVHHHNTFGRNPNVTIENSQTQRTRRTDSAIERVRENLRTAANSGKHLPAERIGARRDRALGTGFKPISDCGD